MAAPARSPGCAPPSGAAEAYRPFPPAFAQELDRLFRWRRDERHFETTPLPTGLLDDLIATACLAPSVGYSQPWRFVKVDDEGRRRLVSANFSACNAKALADQPDSRAGLYARLKLSGLNEAPGHLAVFTDTGCGTGGGLGRATMPETLFHSTILAVHTLWLAATARGVGVGWVSILDPLEVSEILDIPDHWRLAAYLCIGYSRAHATRPELERCGWEQALTRDRLVIAR
ncbi:5,6-dimethylbenzimidazole synthase [Ancylobacter sp. 6x-1]|uniref:5,6-dimethylbenzimidazole synthase n=1 Tax=Ancylobacter crimeensis TaxID=2579147 RepID=A0ABT0D8C0_9HYPH|nr:5,6-dimethylbenzimidazole synthase [Ancylobacter crimeensis]MCK0196190.1 5,6-dimethylbenzimidazole synthase [Ancylobacter crimeensis]